MIACAHLNAAPRTAGFAMAGLVFVLDQLIKWAVMGPWALPTVGQISLLPIFALTYIENHGVSLGLLVASSEASRWLLVALTAAIATVVIVWITRERNPADTLALGLVLGGALGNILDRVRVGFVIDYADLHFGSFRPFLVFNLADAAITFGVLIILARSFLIREKRDTKPANTAPES